MVISKTLLPCAVICATLVSHNCYAQSYVTSPDWGNSFYLTNSEIETERNHIIDFSVVDKAIYDVANDRYKFIYYVMNVSSYNADPVYYKFTWGIPDNIYGKVDESNKPLDGATIKYYKWSLDANNNVILVPGIEGDYPKDYSIRVAVTNPSATPNGLTENARYVANTSYSGPIDNSYAGLNVSSSGAIGVAIHIVTDIFGGVEKGGISIGNITGDFVDNNGATSGGVYGGAIYNSRGIVGDITGNFIGNTITGGHIAGAAIANINSGEIGKIDGDFIANGLTPNSGYDGAGAAITNRNGSSPTVLSMIASVTGDFIGNYIYSVNGNGRGAAIYNMHNAKIGFIDGNFIGNYIIATKLVYGGAINNAPWNEDLYSGGNIDLITGSFINNYITSTGNSGFARGGAIHNFRGEITTIDGDFLGNSVTTTTATPVVTSTVANPGNALGGAIANMNRSATSDVGHINEIKGNFHDNEVVANGGRAVGGAIHNENARINSIDGSFIGNHAISTLNSAFGGAISNVAGTMNIKDSLFFENYSKGTMTQGGAIMNTGTITIRNSIFNENYTMSSAADGVATGGAIANFGTMDLYNSSFYSNYSKANNTAQGGAIFNQSILNLYAVGIDFVFSGNYASDSAGVRNIAVENIGTITFNSETDRKYIFYDGLSGTGNYNLISGAIDFLGEYANFASDSKFNISGGTRISTIDDVIRTTNLGTLNLIGDVNYGLDVNIDTGEGDKLIGSVASGSVGKIIIDEINILNLDTPNYLEINLQALSGGLFSLFGLSANEIVASGYKAQSYNNSTGILSLFKEITLKESVNNDGSNRGYGLIANDFSNETLGVFGGTDLTIIGYGKNITTTANTVDGMTMTANQEITIKNVGTISGFANYFISATDSKININSETGNTTTFVNAIVGNADININDGANTGAVNFDDDVSANDISIGGGSVTFGSIDVTATSITGSDITSIGATFNNATIDNNINASVTTTTFNDVTINGAISGAGNLSFNGTNNINGTISPTGLTNSGTINIKNILSTNATITNTGGIFNLAHDMTLNNGFNGGTFNLYSGKTLTLNGNTADINNATFNSNSGNINASGDGVKSYNLGGDANLTNTGLSIDMTLDFDDSLKVEADTFSGIVEGGITITSVDFSASGTTQNISGHTGDIVLFTDVNSDVTINNNLDFLVMSDSYSLFLTGIKNGLSYTFAAEPNNLISAIISIVDTRQYIMNTDESAGNSSMTGTLTITGNGKTITDGTIIMDSVSELTIDNANFNANIVGSGTKININGSGDYIYGGTIENANVVSNSDVTRINQDTNVSYTLNSGTLKYTNDNYLNGGNSLTLNGGNLNIANGSATAITLASMDLTGISSWSIDVDLEKEEMDTIDVVGAIIGNSKLNISYLNLISDAINDVTKISFTTETDLMDNVYYTGDNPIAYSPTYKYDVSYDQLTGEFKFERKSGDDGYNPSAQVEGVSNQTIYTASLDLGKNLLTSVEAFGPLSGGNLSGGDEITSNAKGTWFKVYASDEEVGLGPYTVDNTMYAGILGVDFKPHELDNGHTGRYSAYLAYINSEQEYNDITINQNGLNFGARAIYNKGNLYGGVVANVGFNLIDANNMYGDEDFETYTMSLSYKTSYDVDLHDNRYFLQPSMTISYIYAYTTSYMSSGGAKVTSDALHVLNLNPQIKFIAKLDNGYTPYGSIGYNWNLEANGEIRTNNAALPDLSVDPYAEYKFGVTRSFDGSISSFVEAVITSGGRQGYSIQAGIKWNY